MARGRPHDPQIKAAIIAALLAGQGVQELSQKYRIAKSVISGWKKTELSSTQIEEIRVRAGDEFTQLLANFLRETIKTLTIQVQFVRDSKWLKEQSAAEIATLFGVTTDKAIRLLEAADLAAEARDSEPDQLEAAAGAPDASIQ